MLLGWGVGQDTQGAEGRGSFKVGNCYKLCRVLRLQGSLSGFGSQSLGSGATGAVLVCLHTHLQSNPGGGQSAQM